MAEPSDAALPNSVSVIGPEFCTPNLIDLVIDRKIMIMSDEKFIVTDDKSNFLFKVKSSILSVPPQRVLIDAAGNQLVTLRQKIPSAHSRWEVFKGDSSNPRDMLFSAKRSSLIQVTPKLDVFLANNTTEGICDFKVEGSWLERSCVIYSGESSTIIAKMQKKSGVQSVLLGKDKFLVTVYPQVDQAFIVALIVILNEIN